MRKSFRVVAGLVGLLALSACSARFTATGLKLSAHRARQTACGGDPNTMGVSPEASRNVLVLKNRAQCQMRKTISCDGVEVSDKPETTESFDRAIPVPAPKGIGGVTAVEITSQRTCARLKIDRNADAGTPALVVNALGRDGNLRLLVSDDPGLQSQGVLLIEEGMNPVQVRYLDAAGHVLGQRDFVLQYAVNCQVVAGESQPRRVAHCAPTN